jgi:hypothetical protein
MNMAKMSLAALALALLLAGAHGVEGHAWVPMGGCSTRGAAHGGRRAELHQCVGHAGFLQRGGPLRPQRPAQGATLMHACTRLGSRALRWLRNTSLPAALLMVVAGALAQSPSPAPAAEAEPAAKPETDDAAKAAIDDALARAKPAIRGRDANKINEALAVALSKVGCSCGAGAGGVAVTGCCSSTHTRWWAPARASTAAPRVPRRLVC